MGRTVVRVCQGWLGVVLGATLVAVPGPGVAGAPASNDPLLASQWGLGQVHAPEAWATACTSAGFCLRSRARSTEVTMHASAPSVSRQQS